MNTNVFSPTQHGINDYILSATMFTAPSLLGLNEDAKKLYAVLGTNLLGYNILTDHPVGLKPVISYDTHEKIDIGNVATLAVLTFHKAIRKDKRALPFHIACVSIAALNVLFTKW